MNKLVKSGMLTGIIAIVLACGIGCGKGGYKNGWPFPEQYRTVHVRMFDSGGLRRGYEFLLTDAVAKMIEARTPYKIVSSEERADTVLSGVIDTGQAVLAGDRYTGRPLEREALVTVEFVWKDLKTGEVLVQDAVSGTASYSSQLGQDFEYAVRAAVNNAAQKIVEHMEIPW